MKTIEISDSAFAALALLASKSGLPTATLASSAILNRLTPPPTAPARPTVEPTYTTLKFTLPTSEVCDLMRFHVSMRGKIWHGWRDNNTIIDAIHGYFNARSFQLSERKWWKPFAKPSNGVPSIKGIIERTRSLLKKAEPSETIAFSAPVGLVGRIDEWARFYGVTRDEACQAALGYYAALWRKEEEKRRPKSPMERFERGLASDARKHSHAKAGEFN